MSNESKKTMQDKIKETYKELKGTASELSDNRAYTEFEDKYGSDAAIKAFSHALIERNISIQDWRTYRKVKHKIQVNPLNGKAILKEVNESAEKIWFEEM